MNQVGTYNQTDNVIRRVYFTGTSTLRVGQVLCYQDDPASTTITTAQPLNHFPFDVQIPDSSNLRLFAGIVAEGSVGKTGPCYIDIVVPRPNDVVQVGVSAVTSIAVGDLLQLQVTIGTQASSAGFGTVPLSILGAFVPFSIPASSADYNTALAAATLKIQPLVQAFQSLASVDTSTSARTLIWVKFL